VEIGKRTTCHAVSLENLLTHANHKKREIAIPFKQKPQNSRAEDGVYFSPASQRQNQLTV